jgi:preprotein translocase subunit SecE
MTTMSDTKEAPAPKKRTGPFTFFAQVRQEARKVTWTSRKETVAASIMVGIMVIIAAVFFYIADALVSFLVRLATGTGGI